MSNLFYRKEAAVWEEALPIGNGRIGAMVYSGAVDDKIQINEDTLWSGCPNTENRNHSMDDVYEIRKLVKDKKYREAREKTSEKMFDVRSQCYVTYGNLHIDIIDAKGEISDYERKLDLESGVAKASYKLNGNKIEKEYFVSLKDDVLVVRIKAESEIKMQIYESVQLENRMYGEDETIVSEGRCPTYASMGKVEYDNGKESIHFCSRVKIKTDGGKCCGGNLIALTSAKDVTVLFSIKTSFNGYDKMPVSQGKEYVEESEKALECACEYSYDELKERHIKEYKNYYDRVKLHIDGENYDSLPTDERIKNYAAGTVDNGLVTMLFDFARYLTITGSAPNTQPMTLQGIWNRELCAPWNSNYTMNINTQMNYWPTETCDLPECHMPFLQMLKDLAEKGNTFGLRGWASWHNSDIWRFNCEATAEPMWGFWQMGGFWSVRHIWEHYLHTRDVEFLKEYFPVMKSACEFLQDWTYENDEGEIVTCPSTSPENNFMFDGKICCVCEGTAMDMSIIYDVFDKTIKAGEILGENVEFVREDIKKVVPVKIGKDGRILEWGREFEEAEPGHRHISHVYGFHPSDILRGEEYEKAVSETLRVRMENGGGHTGWSNAWIACVYARLKSGGKVIEHIRNMFKKSIYPNMFDAHPPFQIDGNFGIAAAICESLMQSHTGEVELISALPDEWKSGYVKGFVTRTGEKINFKWENNKAERF